MLYVAFDSWPSILCISRTLRCTCNSTHHVWKKGVDIGPNNVLIFLRNAFPAVKEL